MNYCLIISIVLIIVIIMIIAYDYYDIMEQKPITGKITNKSSNQPLVIPFHMFLGNQYNI